jgi:PAS domain S-box-containing protein
MFENAGIAHGFCFLWNPGLLWLNVASDSVIALAYFLIPIFLVRILRKRKDIQFSPVLLCFAAFIIACGTTHVMEVVTLWDPIYWVSGALKAVTAVISAVTLVLLVRITPAVLAIPHELADRRFRELIEDAPDAILQVDAQGTIVIANRTAEQLFGYSREELIGSNVDLLIPIANRAAHPGHRDGLVQSGVTRSMGKGMGDLHALRKNGTEVSVEISLSPVESETGALVTAVIRDVTSRKRTEQELALASAQLSSLLESTSTCVLAMDGAWKIEYMNGNAKALLNVDGDVSGLDLWTAFPAADANTHDNLRKAMATREPVAFENYYAPFDLWATVQAHPWGRDGLTIYFNDVSEQRRLTRELESAHRRAESVLNHTSVCVYAVDKAWKITYVNGNAKRVLAPLGDVLGKNLLKAFSQQQASTREKLLEAMATRKPDSFESYFEPLDLSSIVNLHPLEDGGLTIFFNDISEQRRLERELERERDLRSHRIEVLARLSAELAHEIKNPLAIIHARASDLAEMVEERDVERAEVATACTSILLTSDRAIRILRGVAAMARVGTHDPMLEASIAEMVAQAVELVQGRFKVNGILLETEVPVGLPVMECREVQIGQVLVNLLNNAFDAVDGDARSERWVRVVVTVQPGAQHEDHIERVQISVMDGGPGVAPEHRRRLMETFFTTKTMGAGIGIGLSVSRTIAEEHGGQLELREKDGHTCFRLTLPVKAAQMEGVAA